MNKKKPSVKLTNKQVRFIAEYLVDFNATQAAVRAGYSQKNAYNIGAENLSKPYIKTAIDAKLKEIRSEKTASAKEVEEYFTAVMRGQTQSEVVVVEARGDGISKARKIKKFPDEKERSYAADKLAKRHGMYTDKLQIESRSTILVTDQMAAAADALARIRQERIENAEGVE